MQKSNRSEYYAIIHYIIRWDTTQTDRTQRNAQQQKQYITSLPTIPASTLLILSFNRRTADVHTIERNRLLITGVQGNFLSSLIFSKKFLSRSYHYQLFVRFESMTQKVYAMGPQVIRFAFFPSPTSVCSSRVEVVSSTAVSVPQHLE